MMKNFKLCYCYNFLITLSPEICQNEDNKKDKVIKTVKMRCFCLLLKINTIQLHLSGKSKNRKLTLEISQYDTEIWKLYHLEQQDYCIYECNLQLKVNIFYYSVSHYIHHHTVQKCVKIYIKKEYFSIKYVLMTVRDVILIIYSIFSTEFYYDRILS